MKDDSVFSFPVNHSDLYGTSGSPVLNDQGQVAGVLSKGVVNSILTIKTNRLKNFTAGDTGQNCEFMSIKNCLEKDIENLKNLAKQNYAPAQQELAYIYDRGIEVNQNYKEAFYWYKKVAEQGLVLAQRNLGALYYFNREGVPQNYEEAFLWWQKAARQGDPIAQNSLGLMYFNGYGVPQNYKLAFDLLQQSAEQGFAEAQFNLGFMYDNEAGVPQNDELAEYWYQQAAEQGYKKANSNSILYVLKGFMKIIGWN